MGQRIRSFAATALALGTLAVATAASAQGRLPERIQRPPTEAARPAEPPRVETPAPQTGAPAPTAGAARRTLTIATIGDSYAAGEGAPDFGVGERMPDGRNAMHPVWELAKCHRSERSGYTLAARAVGGLPGVSVRYRNFACSGATINVGLLGPYAGVKHHGRPARALDSQLDQVAYWMAEEGVDSLDVLFISIGGNDIGFGRIIESCVSPTVPLGCHTDAILRARMDGGDPDHREEVVGFAGLDEAYDRLNRAIRMRLKPRHIVFSEYPDLVRDEDARFCHAFDEQFAVHRSNLILQEGDPIPSGHPLVGGSLLYVDRNETRFVSEQVATRLNDAVRRAAGRNGWRVALGIGEAARTHGYCSRQPWFNGFAASWKLQHNLNGTAHPNARGHEAYAGVLETALHEMLGIAAAPPVRILNQSFRPIVDGLPREMGRPLGNTTKRLYIELAPTAQRVQVELAHAAELPQNRFAEHAKTVIAVREPGHTHRQLFYVDVPRSEALTSCGWIHYRWTVRWGMPRTAAAAGREAGGLGAGLSSPGEMLDAVTPVQGTHEGPVSLLMNMLEADGSPRRTTCLVQP
jgi:lysophospholipase L1-like esterase